MINAFTFTMPIFTNFESVIDPTQSSSLSTVHVLSSSSGCKFVVVLESIINIFPAIVNYFLIDFVLIST